jgi:hypothetical protein
MQKSTENAEDDGRMRGERAEGRLVWMEWRCAAAAYVKGARVLTQKKRRPNGSDVRRRVDGRRAADGGRRSQADGRSSHSWLDERLDTCNSDCRRNYSGASGPADTGA